jgi:hypothetical protein
MTFTLSNSLANNPYSQIMEVTPLQASRWLDSNTCNRPLNHKHVERLAEDMRAGRWRLTHQGIAFDCEGLLLDGQHRLWAIVEADVPVKMRVFFNEPTESRLVLDCGKRRSNLDILMLGGEAGDVTNRHLATLRALLAGQSARATTLTPGAEAEKLSQHREAIYFAVEHLERGSLPGLCTAQVRAVVARAYYSVDHSQLRHFCNVLKSGIPAGDRDHVILALRDFLSRSHAAGFGDSAQRVRYAKTEWALRAYLDGRCIKRLCASDTELFPLPVDEIPQRASA